MMSATKPPYTFVHPRKSLVGGPWRLDLVSREISMSPGALAALDLADSSETVNSAAVRERIHPDDAGLVDRAIAGAIETGRQFELEFRVVKRSGRTRTIRASGDVKTAPYGLPVSIDGSVHDVTGSREYDTGAALGQPLLAKMLDISPEAIIITDSQSRIQAFSAGASAVFGYAAEEVVGSDVEILMPERVRHQHRHHVARFANGASPSLRMHERSEIRGRRKNGEEFLAEASLAKLETIGGWGFVAIIRDLSAQKAAEQELILAREIAEQATRAKSTFLANMSHELRTPLNGVVGLASALARTELSPKQEKMVQLIEDSARSLEHLLTGILDLSKIDAGKDKLSIGKFDLCKTIFSIFDLFCSGNGNNNLTMNCYVSQELNGIYLGDEYKIRQILTNLMSNARKFTQEGSIDISAAAIEGDGAATRVRISVSDTGVGFPQEAAGHLFDRFEQADNSITRKFGGTGLGLAITKGLVELMGGTISAASPEGRGATFTVEIALERVQPDIQDARPRPQPPLARASSGLRVLLADDHAINRMVVDLILQELEVDLTSVENGQQAVSAFAGRIYDLVLMDMHMPIMDGLTAIGEIRKREAASAAPRAFICMLTADASDATKEAAIAIGANALLTKPTNAAELIALVQSCSEDPHRYCHELPC